LRADFRQKQDRNKTEQKQPAAQPLAAQQLSSSAAQQLSSSAAQQLAALPRTRRHRHAPALRARQADVALPRRLAANNAALKLRQRRQDRSNPRPRHTSRDSQIAHVRAHFIRVLKAYGAALRAETSSLGRHKVPKQLSHNSILALASTHSLRAVNVRNNSKIHRHLLFLFLWSFLSAFGFGVSSDAINSEYTHAATDR
jgi:hypothetical protein